MADEPGAWYCEHGYYQAAQCPSCDAPCYWPEPVGLLEVPAPYFLEPVGEWVARIKESLA